MKSLIKMTEEELIQEFRKRWDALTQYKKILKKKQRLMQKAKDKYFNI